jgi:hypothetical protein
MIRSLVVAALLSTSALANFPKVKKLLGMRTDSQTLNLQGSRFAENGELTQSPVIGIIS